MTANGKIIEITHSSAKLLGILACLLALLTLYGYAIGIESLYRPVAGGPATNPLTGVCTFLIGIQIVIRQRRDLNRLNDGIFMLVILLVVLHIFDILFHSQISLVYTPFESQVLSDIQSGKDNAMGLNTAVMFLFLSLGIGVYRLRSLSWSQLFAFIALGFPFVSVIGYLYGFEQYYGHMSFMTAIGGILLSAGILCLSARRAACKILFNMTNSGKIARLQILSSAMVIYLAGLVFAATIPYGQIDHFLGLIAATVIWFSIILITYTTYSHELAELKVKKGQIDLRMKNRQLQHALDEIRTLRGIIPICAYCQKIRDEAGNWLRIDTYLNQNTDAKLSHGICPDCYSQERDKLLSPRTE